MAIIVEAPHQAAVARPGHAAGIQPFGDLSEKFFRLGRQIGVNIRSRIGDWPVLPFLAVENPQRIALQPVLTVFRKILTVRLKMLDQSVTPGIPAFLDVPAQVRANFLQGHAIGDTQFLQKLIGKAKQFDIRRRFARPDNLCIELVKLPVAAFLRPFITEQGAMGGEFERHMLLPPVGQESARDTRGKFRPQGQAVAAAILETVHFLGHHIGGLAKRAGKDRGRFKHRHFDALECVQPSHTFKCLHNMLEALLLFAKYILGAAHGLGCLYLCHRERFSQ